MDLLRQTLLKNDVGIIGRGLEPDRKATVTASSFAALSGERAGEEWICAEEGAAVCLFDYPPYVEEIALKIKNGTDAPVEAEFFAGYAQTPPIQYFDTPDFVYDAQTGRYKEVYGETERLAQTTAAEGETMPTGSEGSAAYYKREDSLTGFAPSYSEKVTVAPRFEGFAAFRPALTLPGYDRRVCAQGLVAGVRGRLQIAAAPHEVDVTEGMIFENGVWASNPQTVPVFKITPEVRAGAPENVLNGFIHRERKVRLNAWISAPGGGMPQWIETAFEEERLVGEIIIRYDVTERLWKDMYHLRGERAAKRLVKKYKLELLLNGSYITVAEEDSNYLRFRRHKLDAPQKANGVRLTISETWGQGECARVYAIEIYAPDAPGV
jgi:hypothetical protein